MNHNCEYVLKRGARKGEKCRRVALYQTAGDHYCKNHIYKAKIDAAVGGNR